MSAILNHYTDAAEYAERVLEAYKKIYPPISNQIGMQVFIEICQQKLFENLGELGFTQIII